MTWKGLRRKRSWPSYKILSRNWPGGTEENLNQDSRSPGRDLNLGPPEYESRKGKLHNNWRWCSSGLCCLVELQVQTFREGDMLSPSSGLQLHSLHANVTQRSHRNKPSLAVEIRNAEWIFDSITYFSEHWKKKQSDREYNGHGVDPVVRDVPEWRAMCSDLVYSAVMWPPYFISPFSETRPLTAYCPSLAWLQHFTL
jgi:hypothetical protein